MKKYLFVIVLISVWLTSCGTSTDEKNVESRPSIEELNSYIENQIRTGQAKRYNDLNELKQDLIKERNEPQYEEVECYYCGGIGLTTDGGRYSWLSAKKIDSNEQLIKCNVCGGTGRVIEKR